MQLKNPYLTASYHLSHFKVFLISSEDILSYGHLAFIKIGDHHVQFAHVYLPFDAYTGRRGQNQRDSK